MLLSGGGTGGHVYPILAVVDAFRRSDKGEIGILYAGAPGSVEENLAARSDIPFAQVECGQLRGKAPWTVLRNLMHSGRGVSQARQVIKAFRPHVVFSTGGYASVPSLIAARLTGVPAMIFLPDVEPGLAIKLLSRLVDRVAVSFEEVRSYFPPRKVVVTGYPVRSALYDRDKEEARGRLGLSPDEPVLLAFGGSQGARSINRAVVGNLRELLEMAQVVHIAGRLDYAWVHEAGQELTDELGARYHCHEYLHDEMVDALAAADLIVARAGASTLGEFPAVGAPSILVPYPYSGQHQYANAAYMERHGASVMIEDADISTRLVEVAGNILGDSELWQQMATRVRTLAHPDAAMSLARELSQLGAGGSE